MIIQITLIMTLGHTEVVQMHPLAQDAPESSYWKLQEQKEHRFFFLHTFLKHLKLVAAGDGVLH